MSFFGQTYFEVQDYFSRIETYSTSGTIIKSDGTIDTENSDLNSDFTYELRDIGPHAILRFLGHEGDNGLYYPDWINIWVSKDDKYQLYTIITDLHNFLMEQHRI